MNNPIVSVVVPVYNVKRYLPKCLDSLISQTLKNLEIIAIDDGSTDGSSSLLDTYSSKDERIRVFHVNNGGVSSARNIGLSLATGKYVGFVDSDDSVEPAMFETMVDVAERTGSDFVQCEFMINYESGKTELSRNGEDEIVYNRNGALGALMNLRINYNVWSKIYRRERLSGLKFFEQWHYAEDCRFVIDFLLRAKKVCSIPDVLYHYYERAGSLSHNAIDEDKVIGLEIYDLLKERMANDNNLKSVVVDRELYENLKYLNSAIGHSNIKDELIMTMVRRIQNNRHAICRNRFMSNKEKTMAKVVSYCPFLYIFIVKSVKRIKGIK